MISRRSFSCHFEEIFCGNYSMGNVSNGGGGVGILQKTQNKEKHEQFAPGKVNTIHRSSFLYIVLVMFYSAPLYIGGRR